MMAPYLRLRHTRGHGIHSPFVYGLVRNALMFGSGPDGADGELYEALRSCGVNRRRAAQLQNLHNYCEYRLAGVFTAPDGRSQPERNAISENAPEGCSTEGYSTERCPTEEYTIERCTTEGCSTEKSSTEECSTEWNGKAPEWNMETGYGFTYGKENVIENNALPGPGILAPDMSGSTGAVAKTEPEVSAGLSAVRWLTGATGQGILRIFTKGCPVQVIRAEARCFRVEQGAAAVLSPRTDRDRYRLCTELAAAGDCISIDNRGFVLFIYGSGLTPRHYKL